ncbi:hypothetical protein IVB41_34710 [Bradyrhizobium sp. 44]|jgi:hypothetical protein|uniref:hypothetical protein n=1 Tax=Bradyrhizobium sp. 44 TaxID=2782675 RepID=UPI001FF88614|nr:hypothetical protein [Bradyrhizobium sp. 44]MCK1289047.1 hypothetical protein [Bradyrhizobium sp. 44]
MQAMLSGEVLDSTVIKMTQSNNSIFAIAKDPRVQAVTVGEIILLRTYQLIARAAALATVQK